MLVSVTWVQYEQQVRKDDIGERWLGFNIISSNDQLSSRFYQCFCVSLICLLLEAAKLTATHTKLLLFDPLSPSLFLSLKFGWTCKEETSAASIESKEFQNKNSTLRGFSNVQEHFVAHFWLWLWCSWGFVFLFEVGIYRDQSKSSVFISIFFLSLTYHVGGFFSY